jgi:hypothetical protein
MAAEVGGGSTTGDGGSTKRRRKRPKHLQSDDDGEQPSLAVAVPAAIPWMQTNGSAATHSHDLDPGGLEHMRHLLSEKRKGTLFVPEALLRSLGLSTDTWELVKPTVGESDQQQQL